MPEPLTGGLTPNLQLTSGYEVVLTALDPTTGATVTGVVVSNVSMQVDTIEPEREPETINLIPPVLAHVYE